MKKRTQILAIDDDPMFLRIIDAILREHGYDVTCIDHYPTDEETASLSRYHAILLEWDLNGLDGLGLLARLRVSVPMIPVVMVTGREKPTESAVRAIQAGAFDFVPKPLEPARLFASLTKAVEHHRLLRVIADAGNSADDRLGMEGIVGRSPQMQTLYDVIRRVAPTDVSVMVVGESGTGKELVANALHKRSRRTSGPFVAVNMAALPKELVESTLFGHERGAFTGADRQRMGVVEEADGGTLFLDELCEMPIELQSVIE